MHGSPFCGHGWKPSGGGVVVSEDVASEAESPLDSTLSEDVGEVAVELVEVLEPVSDVGSGSVVVGSVVVGELVVVGVLVVVTAVVGELVVESVDVAGVTGAEVAVVVDDSTPLVVTSGDVPSLEQAANAKAEVPSAKLNTRRNRGDQQRDEMK